MAVEAPIILAGTALGEVVSALADTEENIQRSTAEKFKLSEQATRCLHATCASGTLKMVVIDPRTGDRYQIPPQYFEDRPMSDLEFASGLFRACELSGKVVVDPYYRAVLPYRGWAHGFSEPDFRAWLRSEKSSTSGAETRVIRALEQIFERDPDCLMSKAQCLAQLSERKPLGKRALGRVWRRATERCPLRRKAGRKKSNHPAN
jgi:hypothetical protein